MRIRHMKTDDPVAQASPITRLLIAMSALIIASCGGGGGGGTSGNSATNPPTDSTGSSGSGTSHPLTQATDFNDFVAKVTAGNAVALQFFQQYFPVPLTSADAWQTTLTGDSLTFTNGNSNPIQGVYKHYAVADFPQSNANLEFTGSDSGVMSFHSLDTTNQEIENGGAQAFFATYPTQYDLSLGQLKSSLLVESIVTSSGVPQYRYLQVFILAMVSNTEQGTSSVDGPQAGNFAILNPLGTSVTGPIFDGLVGHSLEGDVYNVVLECYVANCQTGMLLHYTDFLQWTNQ